MPASLSVWWCARDWSIFSIIAWTFILFPVNRISITITLVISQLTSGYVVWDLNKTLVLLILEKTNIQATRVARALCGVRALNSRCSRLPLVWFHFRANDRVLGIDCEVVCSPRTAFVLPAFHRAHAGESHGDGFGVGVCPHLGHLSSHRDSHVFVWSALSNFCHGWASKTPCF